MTDAINAVPIEDEDSLRQLQMFKRRLSLAIQELSTAIPGWPWVHGMDGPARCGHCHVQQGEAHGRGCVAAAIMGVAE